MKKVILSIVAASAVFAITSCGGNNENNQAELTQQQLDSIQAATEARVKDSIAAEELRIADSTRVADSLIQAGKDQAAKTQKTTTTTTTKNNNSGKTTTTTKVEEKTPVEQSRDKKAEKLNDAAQKTEAQIQESRDRKASKL